MKFAGSQLAYLMRDRQARSNIGALLKYLAMLVGLITLYAIIFHVVKIRVEG